MKRIAFVFGLAAATAFAAPLAAQSRNDGPWYDPSNTGTRTGSNGRVDSRDGRVYDSRVYNDRRADGQWRRAGRDRNGNTIYARTRYDSNRNIVREVAVRDRLGRYRVIDRDIVQYANRRNDRYDNRGNNRGDDRWDDRNQRGRNDRWDQNNGHDNGKHNGQHKNKNKGKGRGNR